MKRLFDIVFSLLTLVLLSPLLIVISLLVAITSKGGVFYFQTRVGKNNVTLNLSNSEVCAWDLIQRAY